MASKGHLGSHLGLPTNFLPPLTDIRKYSREEITCALEYLQEFYWPPTLHVPGRKFSVPLQQQLPQKLGLPKKSRVNRLIHDESVPDSGYASAEEDDEEVIISVSVNPNDDDPDVVDIDALRADPFERTFAIKWLTGFISRSDAWISSSSNQEEEDERYQTMDEITSLLSTFAGYDQVEEALTRHFNFPREVHVELNDAPISGDDHTSVGLQSWASSIVLAERMCADAAEFGFGTVQCRDEKRRILELGAGTGLLSIVAAKLLYGTDSDTNPEVIATDYHPDVISNLISNIHTNFPSPYSIAVHPPVKVHFLDWQHPLYTAPLDMPFTTILAADVIYHPDHARWIKGCVERLLLRPECREEGEGGIFWLIIPLRSTGRHEGMCNTVDEIFPDLGAEGGGLEWKLAVLEREDVGKQDGLGRADESGYKLFKIGWVRC